MTAGQSRRAALAWLMASSGPPLFAQATPVLPSALVRIIVPAPPGGALDGFARLLADFLGTALGQRFVVDNRAGAGGLIAARLVAQSPADGHMLACVHSGFVTLQAIDASRGPLNLICPIAKVSRTALTLTVRADAPYRSVQALINAARGRPGRLSYASGGIGSPAHMATLRMADSVGGLELVHVPFKGGGEADIAAAAGEVDFNFSPIGTALPLLRSGRLRALAVTGQERWPAPPDVATMTEAGLPGLVIEPWVGLASACPAAEPMTGSLSGALRKAVDQPAVIAHLQSLGALPDFAPAASFAAQIARELKTESALVRRLGSGVFR
jgi:tripartite-type tricarboxylate transporter receptor subunit TctC